LLLIVTRKICAPFSAVGFPNRAVRSTAGKEYDRAIADYNQAIQLNPNDATALYWRGKIKQLKGDTSGGDADIAAAKKIDPNNTSKLPGPSLDPIDCALHGISARSF
jgi:tetratricopeptide (TPR) repeat protein